MRLALGSIARETGRIVPTAAPVDREPLVNTSKTLSLDEILAHFQHLEDPRSTINRRHPLPSVIVIAVLAILAGAKGPTAIARWASFKEQLALLRFSSCPTAGLAKMSFADSS